MEISHIVMGSYFVTRAFTGAPLKFAEPWPVSSVEGLWGPPGGLRHFPRAAEPAGWVKVWACSGLQQDPGSSPGECVCLQSSPHGSLYVFTQRPPPLSDAFPHHTF